MKLVREVNIGKALESNVCDTWPNMCDNKHTCNFPQISGISPSINELNAHHCSNYPDVFTIIGKLSHKAKLPATAGSAKDIAEELNDWLYSAGGMCAEPSAQGALLKLRDACFH